MRVHRISPKIRGLLGAATWIYVAFTWSWAAGCSSEQPATDSSDATPAERDGGRGAPNAEVATGDAPHVSDAHEGTDIRGTDAAPPEVSSVTPPPDGAKEPSVGPMLGGCPLLPANHVFNTRVDALPVHPNSADFVTALGARNIHLDLGTTTDQTSEEYYGIPFNVVRSRTMSWTPVAYHTADPEMTWDARAESDCAAGGPGSYTRVSPCTASAAPAPILPIPSTPWVEGGIVSDPRQPYGDHHILLLDADECHLWETYHSYRTGSGFDIYGSAFFDLRSNALRPAGWTSADAAGFPILPLLLRAEEASTGEIRHALRFTIQSHHIRNQYVWPARHLTNNGTGSTQLPPMGQLYRLKATYVVPATFGVQSKAILGALQRYGMYLADGGSDMYITGEPHAGWDEATFSQVQSVPSSQFEAVDLSPWTTRPGFDGDSAQVDLP